MMLNDDVIQKPLWSKNERIVKETAPIPIPHSHPVSPFHVNKNHPPVFVTLSFQFTETSNDAKRKFHTPNISTDKTAPLSHSF